MEMDEIPEFLRRKVGDIRPPVIIPEISTGDAVGNEFPNEPVVDDGPSPFEKIQRGMRENASALIAEINEAFDAFVRDRANFNTYEFLRIREAKPAIAQLIIDKFRPQLEELESIKTDSEIREAYRGYTDEQIQDMKGWLMDSLAGTQRWIDNQSVGKVSKKVVIVRGKPKKQIKNLKYQIEDRGLKLISIPPEKIVGAHELWTYNTKYKHLTHYVAQTRRGFAVKGTTLQDFDIDKSVTKVVRHPEEVLTKVLEKQKKIMDGLKTKTIIPTGRINENTIILRAS